jgi:intracellular multiplication protein IcmK
MSVNIRKIFGVLIVCAGAVSWQLAQAQDTAPPSDTALPQFSASDLPRSPGMGIPVEDPGLSEDVADPFAEQVAPVKTPEQAEREIRDKAFDAALTGLLPLEPAQIRKLLEEFDRVQQAVETPVYPYPKPEIVVQTVSVDPGSTPPEIKVAPGHVTTLNILDSTGAKWPILDITWAGNFQVVQPGQNGNVIRITPMSEFAYGNMAVMLAGFPTPVSFIIKTHRDSVHYRFDARIPGMGPLTETPIMEGGVTMAVAGDSALSAIMDGVIPEGAEKFKVEGVDSRTTAYLYNDITYVRTPLTLLSPGWSKSTSSADGMNVYAVADAPVLLLSDQGRMVRARLGKGTEDHDE